ncbi:aldo/keto reductase [Enterococcus sp. HY326]|uniref:aldo/keto reductase n=1 Tax=Enterococcus sp. HY326 TaxID=2971265 RepID=UPI00223EBADF|nr:aldo/keto reductase [Enterococcus sp. HY326]
MTIPTVTLNNGAEIPQFGIGVYQIEGDELTKSVVLNALNLGYRHIDTAHGYGNERGVGAAVKESGIPREEIWVTSKLWPSEYGEGKTEKAIDKMLNRLNIGAIDMVLLHQQFGDFIGAWKDLEKAVTAGKIKTIGISNFESDRLEELLEVATIYPAVNQVECHPYYPQDQLIARIKNFGTKIESWYPLGHADEDLLNEPIFSELAKKYNKTNAQVILRWHIQKGFIIFPRTTSEAHLKENIDIFDFALTDSEMTKINELDRGQRFFEVPLEKMEKEWLYFVPEDHD